MSIKREQLSLDRGEERAADGTNFDVTAWRSNVDATLGRLVTSDNYLRDILKELKKMNEQLSFITGEEL